MSGEDERKLFVAGLADSVTEDVLRQLFEASGGKVSELTIPQDRATGRSRGFGFVTMDTAEEAQQARTLLDGSVQGGRPISVRPFRGERGERPGVRPPSPPEEATLYVGNLPFDANAEDVTKKFGEMGFSEILRVHLPMDPEGRARGFGFVSMKTPEEARRAAEELSGLEMGGRNVSVSVARARGARPERPSSSQRGPRPYVGATSFDEPRADPPGGSSPRMTPPRAPHSGGGADFPLEPNTRGGDERRTRGVQAPVRKKDKKRKNKGGGQERGGRRNPDGFHSPRAADYVDAWDDDD